MVSGKEPACQCRRGKRHQFHPWVGEIPWRRAWQPTPVFLPGKSHGQRSLAATVHRVRQSDTTEVISHTCNHRQKDHILDFDGLEILKSKTK